MPIVVRIESFEGPLDLLLFLIQSHALDISRISIEKITDQYLAYVKLLQELNFDIASEFLVMAATLLQWKSKAILPREEDAPADSQEESELSPEALLRQLEERARFHEVARKLSDLPLLGSEVFSRQNRKPPTEKIWREMELSSLVSCYQNLLTQSRKRKQVLKKETVSLSGKIRQMSERLRVGELREMSALISDLRERPEVVVTFLASLELSKLKKLRTFQEGTYQEIYLELLESLAGLDDALMKGFDQEFGGNPSPQAEPGDAGSSLPESLSEPREASVFETEGTHHEAGL
jgi:segregation and condensation protein A